MCFTGRGRSTDSLVMVFHALYSLFRRFVDAILQMLGVSSSSPRIGGSPNTLHVHVKYAGRTVQVDLDPSWSVSRVKDEIAPLLKVNPNEIKIIFAGNELPDSFLLEVIKCYLNSSWS